MTDRSEAMRTALAQVLADNAEHPSDRGLITGFIVIAEVIGDDGDPWLKSISDDGPRWRTLGMLTSVSDDLRQALSNLSDD